MAGIEDILPSFFRTDVAAGAPMSYEALQTRRRIAEQLAGKRSPFPKNIGEGLTYLGEALGDRWRLGELDAADRRLAIQRGVSADEAIKTLGGSTETAPAAMPALAPTSARVEDGGYNIIDTQADKPAGASSELNRAAYDQMFKGTPMEGRADKVIETAAKHNIPPSLMAGIIAHESGRGTSNMIRNRNNPAGIMNPRTNWMTGQSFPDIDAGIAAAGPVIAKNYQRGGGTIEGMARTYAPPKAANDPGNLNRYWAGGVNKFSNQLGGGGGAGVPEPEVTGPGVVTASLTPSGGTVSDTPPVGGREALTAALIKYGLRSPYASSGSAPPATAPPPPVALSSPPAGDVPEPAVAQADAGNPPIMVPGIRSAPASLPQGAGPTIPQLPANMPPDYRMTEPVAPPAPPQTPMSKTELDARRRVLTSGGDPVVAQQWGQVVAAEEAKRKFIDSRNIEEHKAQYAHHTAMQTIYEKNKMEAREKALATNKQAQELAAYPSRLTDEAIERAQKIQTGQINLGALPEQRRQEQVQREIANAKGQGELPAGSAQPPPPAGTYDRRLGTPASPQRVGIPTVPPVPAGVAPQKWAELHAPLAIKASEAVEQAVPQFGENLKALNLAREHPGKEWGVGVFSQVARNTPGTAAYGFGKIMDQIAGKNFLAAYQQLKGAGAITEIEGTKAEAAQARLATAQNKDDFNKALIDFETMLRSDLERAQRKTNMPVTAWRRHGDNSSFAPDVGERTPGGTKEYIGGNPGLPESWRDVR